MRALQCVIQPHFRSSYPEVFLGKGVLKICSKFTGEHPCRSVISIKLLCNFIEITLWHGCSPVHLLHIFRTPFTKDTSGLLLLSLCMFCLVSKSNKENKNHRIQITQSKCKGFCLQLDKLKYIPHEEFERLNWLPMTYRFQQCVNSVVF